MFLFWPLVALGLAVVTVGQRLARNPGEAVVGLATARAALMSFCHLSGVKVDVESAGGDRVWIRLW